MTATLLGGLIYLEILLLQPRGVSDTPLTGWLIAGPLLAIGIVVVAQWVLLRCYLGKISPWRWLSASLVGWAAIIVLMGGTWIRAGDSAVRAGPLFGIFYLVTGLVGGVVLGLGGGALLGALQAWVLKPYQPG